jgi:hypothetical protein
MNLKFDPIHGMVLGDNHTAETFRANYPDVVWRYNPWTGVSRDPRDFKSDPYGFAMVAPGEPLKAAEECVCFPGLCRGGEVVNGKTASGHVCRAEVPLKRKLDEVLKRQAIDSMPAPLDVQKLQEAVRQGIGQRLDDKQVGGSHYSNMAITPWQFLESCLTPDEMRGYLKGEAIVYIARELQKNGAQDISKARHVLQKLEEIDAKGK